MMVALAAPPVLLAQDGLEHFQPPPRVLVRPVFVVPAGQRDPSADERAALLRHLRTARDRYTVMLGGRDSFGLEDSVRTVRIPATLGALRAAPFGGAPDLAAALLDQFHVTRFECPWVFVAIVMNDADDFPTGAGEPLNGGLNNGGGIIEMSSYALDRLPNVQSTFQHELGHAFGLPHVDAYGRGMDSDASVMSYNLRHHTRGFAPSATPGILVREDLRALALNHRAFASLTWDSTGLAGAEPRPVLVTMGPMEIPGHPASVIEVTTTSGSLYGSRPDNVVRGAIAPSPGPEISFDQNRMWHSDSVNAGWVELDLTFPVPVTLTGIRVHSGHSGRYHLARRARVATLDADPPRDLADAPLAGMDAMVAFAGTTSRRWRVALMAGPRRMVVVRGLRFLNGSEEILPR